MRPPIITKISRERRKRDLIPLLMKGWKILDAGSGDGHIVRYLKNKGYNCIGADRVLGNDLRKLPFKNNSFDCIICFHVLEHVICEYELKRVLKPGGLSIVEVPTNDFVFHILDFLGIVQAGVKEHIRMVKFKNLPFKFNHSYVLFYSCLDNS